MSTFLKDLLRLVALLCGEDLVCLGGGDGKGPSDGGELLLLDERGMGQVADLDAVFVMADNILEICERWESAPLSDEDLL